MLRLTPLLLLAALLQACEVEEPWCTSNEDCSGEEVCLADDPEGELKLCGIDADGDGLRPGPMDCDDNDPLVHVNAPERCNAIDDDCDGEIDELGDSGIWFLDADGDGYGDPDGGTPNCRPELGLAGVDGDCDDDDPEVNPVADERCNGVDDDCDGWVDDRAVDAIDLHADQDGDGWGVEEATRACPGEGWVEAEAGPWDCDDRDAEMFPGSTAHDLGMDGRDVDCDGRDACTDLDCDGFADLVFPDGSTGGRRGHSVYYSNGSAGFDGIDRALFTAAQVQHEGIARDLDDDGYLDLVFPIIMDGGNRRLESLVWWGAHPGDTWPPHADQDTTGLPTFSASGVCADDVDGDGDTDLFFSKIWYQGEQTWLYRNRGDRTFAGEAFGSFSDSAICVLEDLNADGHVDVLLNAPGGGSRLFPGDSSGPRPSSPVSLGGGYVDRAWSGDIDQDGDRDLILDVRDTGLRVHLGAPGVSASAVVVLPAGYGRFSVADIDQDGTMDVIRGLDATQVRVTFDPASGTGASHFDLDVGALPRDVVVTDIDDDGSPDLLVGYAGCSAGDPRVYWGTGDSAQPWDASDHRILPSGLPSQLRVADMDLDGNLDVVTSDRSDSCGAGPAEAVVHWNGGARFDSGDRTTLPVRHASRVLVVGAPCIDEACND